MSLLKNKRLYIFEVVVARRAVGIRRKRTIPSGTSLINPDPIECERAHTPTEIFLSNCEDGSQHRRTAYGTCYWLVIYCGGSAP